MAFPGRRSRGRRPAFVIGVLALVLATALVINASVSARSDKPARTLAAQAWVDQVMPLVASSSSQGQEVADTRTQATSASVDSVTIGRRMDRVVSESQQVLDGVRALKPPKSVATAHDLLVATMAIRAETAKALREALGVNLTTGSVGQAADALVAVGDDLAAGDRTYDLFRRSLPPGLPGPPDSKWKLGEEDLWTKVVLSTFVSTLRNKASTAPIHDVTILLISTEPVPIGTEGDNQILPAPKTLRVQIVVANLGNQSEKHDTVTATVNPSSLAGGGPDSARDFVDLAPGQRTTVTLGGLAVPPAGTPFTLTVRIEPVGGESNITDNERSSGYVVH